MNVIAGDAPKSPSGFARLKTSLLTYGQPRVALMLALGFSSGLPFLLIFGTLSAWLREAHISRTDIGLMSYVGLAYTIKFLWAPIMDQVRVPVLAKLLGKRRSWMLVAQFVIAGALIAISFCDPSRSLGTLAVSAVVLAFAAATQDISIDAWRIEAAPKEEQGAMAAAYQLGYRLAILASGAGALYIAQYASWHMAYLSMALCVGVGVIAVLLAPRGADTAQEPPAETNSAPRSVLARAEDMVRWLYTGIVAPFSDFFSRHKWTGVLILALIGIYRVPDFVMGVMANPLYIDLGFSLATIATVIKVFGVWITIFGAFAGGLVVARFGLLHTLLAGACATLLGNLVFAWLATQDSNVSALTIAIAAENFAGGFAGTALIAYMSSLTSQSFTATQYALFTSFYALPGKLLGGLSGIMVDWFAARPGIAGAIAGNGVVAAHAKTAGYVPFFIATASMAIPAILLTLLLLRRERAQA